MRATRRTPGPATASGAWGRREICAAGSIAYPARHAVARSAKAGRWADDAVARVVELVREDSLQATGRYTDVKNAIDNGGALLARCGYAVYIFGVFVYSMGYVARAKWRQRRGL